MENVLSRGGRALKHEAIREYVRSLVAEASPGSPAPSERELVQRFGVARMTVRQAMDALVVEGLLERVPGRGTFVARPRRSATRVLSFTEEMTRRGLRAESQTLLLRLEEAGPGVARALRLTPGDPVVHWRRLRHADGQPMCVQDAYLDEALLPGLVRGVAPTSLYDELGGRGLRPTWVEDTATAEVVGADDAGLLGIAAGTPVLRTQRRALSGDKVVEVSRTVYRADRFTLRTQLGADA
jgi:GntR family transcriptional regulator